MEYRKLGRTGLEVSAIGLGTEYTRGQPAETVSALLEAAIDRGINYIDVIFTMPEFLDHLAPVLRRRRDEVFLTGHLGSHHKDGQYAKTRSMKLTQEIWADMLRRLGTDRVDVLFLHNCDGEADWAELTKPGGQMELAARYKAEGQARFIGFSGHTVETARQALELDMVDVLMFPINLSGNAVPGKRELLAECAARQVGVVAMKPFGGGKLLREERTVTISHNQVGGDTLTLAKKQPITPVHCLAYVLAQPGLSTVVPGCKDVAELEAALSYLSASEAGRDFAPALADFAQYREGECVYCNHCWPCPAGIDIGQVMRLLDEGRSGSLAAARTAYAALEADGADCQECGACVERCPFGADPMAGMAQAAELLG